MGYSLFHLDLLFGLWWLNVVLKASALSTFKTINNTLLIYKNMKKGENHVNYPIQVLFDYLHVNYMLFTYSVNFQVLHWQDFLLNCSVSFIRISSENVLSLERQ